jgi:hypothetical protein
MGDEPLELSQAFRARCTVRCRGPSTAVEPQSDGLSSVERDARLGVTNAKDPDGCKVTLKPNQVFKVRSNHDVAAQRC